MICSIVFDWSGTLVDDLPAVLEASNYVFRQAGVREMSLEEFRGEFCLPFHKFYDRYVAQVPVRQLEEWFHYRYRQVQDWVVELPHAREFLQFCRQREIRSFLLSSVHRDHFAVQAARTGLGDFFDRVYVEAWDKRAKIRELLGEHRLVAKETMLVGDMEHDVETARHGGVHACAVLTGYNKLSQLRASGPDLIVENLLELQKVLEKSQLDPFGRDCRVCRT